MKRVQSSQNSVPEDENSTVESPRRMVFSFYPLICFVKAKTIFCIEV